MLPTQYLPERIRRKDVQNLLRKVNVRPQADFSQRFPAEMPCRITVSLKDGQQFTIEKRDYEGFRTRPMQWDGAVGKFAQLTQSFISPHLQRKIIDHVQNLDNIQVSNLTTLLARV